MPAISGEMWQISWDWVPFLAPCGILMALVSCFVGMKPKVENPAWWVLYLGWILIAVLLRMEYPLLTLWVSSVIAGALHGATTAICVNAYMKNNPWHAENMPGPRLRWRLQFLLVGPFVGFIFGAVVGVLGWAILRYVV